MLKNKTDDDPAAPAGMKGFVSIVSGLAEALGPDYCVVLYVPGSDGTVRAHAVANGGIAGLAEGDGATAADLAALDEIRRPGAASSLQYFPVSATGRRLRSSLMCVAGPGDAPAAFLAVHYDLSRAEQVQSLLAQLTGGTAPAVEETVSASSPPDVNALVEQGLQRARLRLGKPLLYAGKMEKIQVVEWLDRDGFFLFKGAVETLAQEMGNTKYTIYAYLRETRMRSAD